ncbi:MAG: protoporphyrinogen oxidase [Opitutales bacterium]|nr:protoporphyrinogen oxidase [Opitutales bacterium]
MKKALILGGGIAGLTVANSLALRGIDFLLIEKSTRVGGAIRTFSRDGFIAEGGPQTFIAEEKKVFDFLRATGILEKTIEARPAAKKRFIVRGGKPRVVPMSPATAVTTPLFSLLGKIRLLAEPFIPAKRDGNAESVANFVRRRIGKEMYNYALNPLVAGIFAGNPETLDVRFAFPKVWNLEQRYGSLIRGTFPNAKAKKASGNYEKKRTLSFPQGMETLPKLLRAKLDPRKVRIHSEITNLTREGSGWRAHWRSRAAVCTFFEEDAFFDEIIVATPPHTWGEIPFSDPALRAHFSRVPALATPPVTMLTLGFPRANVSHPLDGFGMLVPEKENRKILGTLFTSSLFPGRAPEGFVTLSTYLGGSRQSEITHLSAEEQLKIVREELRELLGATGEPAFIERVENPQAIPQYNLGYEDFFKKLSEIESAFPLRFAGNFRGGISVGQTMLSALETAEKTALAAHS